MNNFKFLAIFLLLSPLNLLSESRPSDFDSKLCIQLTSRNLTERLNALAELDNKETIPLEYLDALLSILKEKQSSSLNETAMIKSVARHKTILIITKMGKDAVPGLREMMKIDDLRWETVEILAEMGTDSKEALPELITALSDQNPSVRYLAAKAIMRIGKEAEDAVPTLMQTIHDPHESAREFSIQALGAIGAKAAVALPELNTLLEHQDIVTQMYARKAIKAIQDDASANSHIDAPR